MPVVYVEPGPLPAWGRNEGWTGANVVEVYDPQTDKWETLPHMPTGRSTLAAAVLDGKIYAIGGYIGPGPVPTVEVYDPQTNEWSEAERMPTPRMYCAASTVGRRICVTGGVDSRTFELFDLDTNRWWRGPELRAIRRGHAAVTIGNLLYLVGGDNGEGMVATVEVFEP